MSMLDVDLALGDNLAVDVAQPAGDAVALERGDSKPEVARGLALDAPGPSGRAGRSAQPGHPVRSAGW